MRLFSRRRSTPQSNGLINTDGSPFSEAVERRAFEIGRELLDASRGRQRGLLSGVFWQDKLMDWAMKDEGFKTQLFRFVDVFPTLKTPEQVHDLLTDYLSQPGVTPPPGFELGMKAGGLLKGTFARTTAKQITAMAEKFIAGTDAADALPTLQKLWKKGLSFSVDLLGEACITNEEAQAYQHRYLDLVTNLPETVRQWKASDKQVKDHLGAIPRSNVSIKISSLAANTDPVDTDNVIAQLLAALEPILKAAKQHDVLVNFDMEQAALKDLTLELFMAACEKFDFTAGLAMQAYLVSGDADAKRIADWARAKNKTVTVRLVKGAYWDYETIHAEQENWPSKVWPKKAMTDACFERMARIFLDATPRNENDSGVKLACGSHNLRSIGATFAYAESLGLPNDAIELQMLYGMADPLKEACLARGLRVREYVPVGEMIPGMAYLVRRLLENTSNESWLKAGFKDDESVDKLLQSPHARRNTGFQPVPPQPERHQLSPAIQGLGDDKPFFTESARDFSSRDVRRRFASAIRNAEPGTGWKPVLRDTGDVQAAVQVSSDAFIAWRDRAAIERAKLIDRAAELMHDRRDELAGIIIKENGKNWANADADVCEAIDFCRYYAREAVGLFTPRRLGRFVGEINEQFHQPRGVAVVISPWNFPIAIACGMTTAALATGNTVILKPAEQTLGIASELVSILHQAGVPKDVLQMMPGLGDVGAALVRDPRVAIVAFTGSRDVGLDILRAASPPSPLENGAAADGLTHVKKVIAEMGGKNAIIVDSTADLDEAVVGVRDSAFGFAGQKCSACSRVIVLSDIHDVFLARLVNATKTLVVGDPIDPSTDIGPLIDADAVAKVRAYIEIGNVEGKLELGDSESSPGTPGEGGVRVGAGVGPSDNVLTPALTQPLPAHRERSQSAIEDRFIGPHIFSGITAEHRLANEEVFGPVLAVMKADSFEHALQIANGPVYKLTGGVFSRTPENLDRAKLEYRVGNLYLNRGITGALVGRQPFGGFGMSGVGSKAGGREYLLQFVEPRVVTENAMRRGFAPELSS